MRAESVEPVKSPARGASLAKTKLTHRISAWWRHHKESATGSLTKLLGRPLPTLMTALVVAIALALPATLYALLDNVYRLGDQWDSNPKLSVYLDVHLPASAVPVTLERLKQLPEIADIEHISAEQAFALFQSQSGFGSALDVLDENPLPETLIVTPSTKNISSLDLQALADRIKEEPSVDTVEVDLEWVKKLKAMMALGEKIVFGLAGLLALGVLLAIGNTIRLEIENRREEIIVVKLVGGTNGFVRRPLLYTGFWYGAIGALLGCILVAIATVTLGDSVATLASTYQSNFKLRGLGLEGFGILICAGSGVGLLGAWIAVTRHLNAIEPR